MWNRIERVTNPAAEALTATEVKAHCRIDSSDQDTLIERLIRASRQMVEGPDGAGIALMASQWTLKMDYLAVPIRIPMGPVLSIDSISYVDEAGDPQTIASDGYQWRKGHFEALIMPPFDAVWPTTRRVFDAATVTFTAGFPGTDDSPASLDFVPEDIRQAMLMLIGHWFEHRETVVVGVVPTEVQFAWDAIMNKYRVGRVV